MPQRLFLLACLLSCAWSFKMELRHPGHHNHSGLIQPRGVGVSIQIRAPIEGGLCTDRNTLRLKYGESVVITSPDYEAPDRINCWWKFVAERNVALRIKCDLVDLKRRDMIMIRGGRGSTIRVRGPSTDPIDVVLRRNKFKMSFKARAKEVSTFSCLVTVGDVDDQGEDCVCGVANTESRIGGGAETEVNEYPWHVGLIRRGRSTPYCGGSIINNLYILTSAYCTRGAIASDRFVLVGEHDISDGSNTLIQAKSILVHENFNEYTLENAMALIELEDELDFSDSKIGPICLPVDTSVDYLDVVATVAGWGTSTSDSVQSTVLEDVEVTVISNSDCGTIYGLITSDMLCAGKDGKNPCQGDRGGPLFSPIAGDAAFEQIGVLIWSTYTCRDPNRPSVYSRVTENLEWILFNSRKGVKCPRPTSPQTSDTTRP